MTSSAFRQIAFEPGARRQDQVFKASIAAFSMVERPSRREISSIEDLGLGLYDTLTDNAKRYAAEALAEASNGPRQLIRRLAREPASVSAPLLLHSPLLSDADLVELIASHGFDHGRLIARRRNLNRAIADLIRHLRMQKSNQADALPAPAISVDQTSFERLAYTLRDRGIVAMANTLSQQLAIPASQALRMSLSQDDGDLSIAMRHLGFDPAQAFLVAAMHNPAKYDGRAAMDGFLERYANITTEIAARKVADWRSHTLKVTPAYSAAMVI